MTDDELERIAEEIGKLPPEAKLERLMALIVVRRETARAAAEEMEQLRSAVKAQAEAYARLQEAYGEAYDEWNYEADERHETLEALRKLAGLAAACLLKRDGAEPCLDCGGHDEHFPNCPMHFAALTELESAIARGP